MRRLATAVLALLLIAAVPICAQAVQVGLVNDPCATPAEPSAPLPADWPNLCRYRAANLSVNKQTTAGHRVVFIGDSITENWAVADPAFFGREFINRGISGQTTPQILLRFRADVIALRPEVVHIMAGTNDVAGNTGPSTLEDVENNFKSMVDLALANAIKVVLASIPPADDIPWRPGLQPAPKIQALNVWLREYAASRGLVYLDYYRVLTTNEGALRPELGQDGVHPNRAGYDLMEPLARAAIAQARKGRVTPCGSTP
jgi:lysophospholipase L1-like esterase